jgi:hypothetical protein
MALVLSQDFPSLADITAAGGTYGNISILTGGGPGGVDAVNAPDANSWIAYPGDLVNQQKGTIEFWLATVGWDTTVGDIGTSIARIVYQSQWSANYNVNSRIGSVFKSATQKGQILFGHYINEGKPDYRYFSAYGNYSFPKEFGRNQWNRFKLCWDFSQADTNALSVYYDGTNPTATAVCDMYSGIGRLRLIDNAEHSFGSPWGQANLGEIVDAINAMTGWHATLIGNPAAQGWFVEFASVSCKGSLNAVTVVQKNSYVILQMGQQFSPVTWFKAFTPDSFVPGNLFYLGNRNYKDQGLRAKFAKLRIYDTVELPVTPFPQYFFNPNRPADITLYDSLFANDGFAGNHETSATCPADCPVLDPAIHPGEDVLAFEVPAFDWVMPSYVPATGDIKTTFAYKVPLGEYETVFFNLYPRIALNNMALNYTALTGPGTILKTNLDLRVVWNWWQGTPSDSTVKDPLPVYGPELMLHCDIFDGVTQINPQLDPTIGQFKIPTFIKQDHVDTSMAAYTAKQFGLTLYVPADTPPGNYTGTVTITATEIVTPIVLTLNFTVLPFALREANNPENIATPWSAKESDVDYWAALGLNWSVAKRWDVYQQIFAEMIKYGITGVQICCNSDNRGGYASRYGDTTYFDYVSTKVEIAKTVGMKFCAIYAGNTQADLDAGDYTVAITDMMQAKGFDPYLKGQDEPGTSNVAWAITKAQYIRSVNGLPIHTGTYEYAMIINDSVPLAYWSLSMGDNHPYDLMAGRVEKKPSVFETYYFQTRTLYPQYERYYSGYFRHLTGCNGPMPSWFTANPNDYTDFNRVYTAYGVVYLGLDKTGEFQIIPTLHGCSMREGFKDDKYLATWQYYYDRIVTARPAEAAASLAVKDAILVHYYDEYPYIIGAGLKQPMSQYAADREAIIQEILTLKGLQVGRSLVGGVIPNKISGKYADKIAGVKQ